MRKRLRRRVRVGGCMIVQSRRTVLPMVKLPWWSLAADTGLSFTRSGNARVLPPFARAMARVGTHPVAVAAVPMSYCRRMPVSRVVAHDAGSASTVPRSSSPGPYQSRCRCLCLSRSRSMAHLLPIHRDRTHPHRGTVAVNASGNRLFPFRSQSNMGWRTFKDLRE